MKLRFLRPVFGSLALLASAATVCGQTTLANALDATNLVWTTGGTGGVGWFYEAQDQFGGDNTFDGVDSARSGHIGDNGETWLQTTVVGPGTVSFWWNAYSEPDADFLQFYINADLQDQISGVNPASPTPSGWLYRCYPVPAGTNVLKWRYVKDAALTGGTLDCAWVDQVKYVTTPPPPLYAALDTCGVTWTSGGNDNPTYWFGQTNITHDGVCAAQSGAIWHNQTNWLQTTVSGETNVSFWWKVSSELNNDVLEFYTNGVFVKRISGEVNWQSNFFKLPATTNTLTWLYRRNASLTAGTNCGWLDQVKFSPPPKPGIVYYATNLTLSTTATNCQAYLPDLTGPAYLLLADNCSSVTVTQMPPVGTVLAPGSSHVALSAFDASGNTTRVTNTVVVADLSPPVITLNGPNPLTNQCPAAWADPGVTASDGCSGVVSLTTNSTVNPAQPGVYTVQYVAVDGSGNAATNTRTVYIVDAQPPIIIAQPQSLTNHPGTEARFSVAATACSPLSYQWRLAGNPLLGQTGSTCRIGAVTAGDAGTYAAVVTSSGGSVTSAVAVLTVLLEPATIIGHQVLSDGRFKLTFSGPCGQSYRVLAGSDVTSPVASWTVLTNGTIGAGPVVFTDTSATNLARRFYRVVSP